MYDIIFEMDTEKYSKEIWDLKEKIYNETGFLPQNKSTVEVMVENCSSHLAFDNGDLVGFILLQPGRVSRGLDQRFINGLPFSSKSKMYVPLFGVHPTYSGQGIGSSLISVVIRKYDTIYCHVRKSNDYAIDFYLSHGFEKDKEVVGYYGNDDTAYRMVYK